MICFVNVRAKRQRIAVSLVLVFLLCFSLQAQTSDESFRLIVTKVRNELVTVHVPPSELSPTPVKVDGFRIWAESKKKKFELTGFVPTPMSEDECRKLFKLDSCKMQLLGRPEVGKAYDATRISSAALCLFDPKEKATKSGCYQIEAEETKK